MGQEAWYEILGECFDVLIIFRENLLSEIDYKIM
jgi:hypothetical protein